jgi:hypothetical protein
MMAPVSCQKGLGLGLGSHQLCTATGLALSGDGDHEPIRLTVDPHTFANSEQEIYSSMM